MRRKIPTPPPRAANHGLRDVRDLEAYVSKTLAGIGVRHSSLVHAQLLEHGLRLAYRLERALPPEVSLREVLDQVLGEKLVSGLRRLDRQPAGSTAVAVGA